MCLIIYSQKGYIPESHLAEGLKQNPDGWGFMVGTGKHLIVQKGLSNKRFWRAWQRRPEGPVVWHARIGTHGTKGLSNCHPFWVNNNLAMAHNGIINGVASDPVLSDTRVFVRDILQHLPDTFLDRPALYTLVKGFIGWSKLVFMNPKGHVWIVNEALGHWRKGLWYSNDGYKPQRVVTTKYKAVAPLNSDRRLPEYYRNMTRTNLYNPYVVHA